MNAPLHLCVAALMGLGFGSILQALPPVQPPAEVVRITYEAANAGRYAAAEKHLSVAALKEINGMMARLAGGHIKLWDQWTKNRTISSLEVLKEEAVNGEVTVYFRLHFMDGSSKEDDDSLVLEGGEWKLLP